MPAASASSSRSWQHPARPAPALAAQVRWDRLGRVAMLFVLGALLYLYLSAGVHLVSKLSQVRRDRATVVALEREHAALARQHSSLGLRGTVEEEARQLGMIRPGEQPYIASGLPRD
jgi:cell division protein FtsB